MGLGQNYFTEDFEDGDIELLDNIGDGDIGLSDEELEALDDDDLYEEEFERPQYDDYEDYLDYGSIW